MKTAAWIVGGLALTGIATMLSQPGPAGGDMALGVQLYLPTVILGVAGQYCFWRALRSGVGDVWSVLTGRNRKPSAPESQHRSSDSEMDDAGASFDADEAFARYMEQRETPNKSPDISRAPPPAVAHPVVRARSQGGFGRKVV